ncbi:MAG: hypothetical protein AAF990_08140 [Bacteroidota bacterium]
MKKSLFTIFTLLLMGTALLAQPSKDAYKTAKKEYFKAVSMTDNESKAAKLMEARTSIDAATASIGDFDARTAPKVWVKSGEINNELASIDFNAITLGQQKALKYPMAPFKAYENFKMAIEAAGTDKKMKRDKNDAVSALQQTFNCLDNAGRIAYAAKEYDKATKYFNANIDIRNTINANVGKDKQLLATDKEYNDYLFLVGLSSYQAKMNDIALDVFTKLKASDYQEATVYDALYTMTAQTDKDAALAILSEGREKFPSDENLRVKEINYYLSEGKLDELVGKLQSAIDATPDNLSLYLTLGHVYDNLFQRELEAENKDKAQEHFDNALKYYQSALDKDSKNIAATYNIGALYYNKAATMTKELIALEGDYSKAGLKKYEEKKTEVFAAFDEALPFFKKAESMDPNDVGTLTALKEIFAKKDDLEKYNEFKARLENIQGGGKNDKPYFQGKE